MTFIVESQDSHCRLSVIGLVVLGLLLLGASAAHSSVTASADDPGLSEVAHQLSVGDRIRVSRLDLATSGEVDLYLERFEVFSPRARIVVNDGASERTLSPPPNAYFKGSVQGEVDSFVLLSVFPDGGTRGVVGRNGNLWILGGGLRSKGPAVGMATREIDVQGELDPLAQSWDCAAGDLVTPANLTDEFSGVSIESFSRASATTAGTSYTARIGIETDWEFFSLFGNTADAVDYIADLIAYGSVIYSAEVDTSWMIETIYLYTSSNDPWGQTSTSCGLREFGRYWNDYRTGVDRTIAHFLSGKRNRGGIAWLGVLCQDEFYTGAGSSCPGLTPSTDNYGGGYGYTGQLSGSFNLDNPTAVWDMVAVAHEIGHNFDSLHTHDYCGIGGNPNPVDACVPAQYGPACNNQYEVLPSGCTSSRDGCGTIMSYCHLNGWGMSNISLTLGLGHPFGAEPARVPSQMMSHVISRASSAPSCLAPVDPPLFVDDFESSTTSAWSSERQ